MGDKRAVILGGMGFIGSRVARILASKGVKVTVVDRTLGNDENITYIKGSAFDMKLLDDVVLPGDDVFHFAYSGVPASNNLADGINNLLNLDELCGFCVKKDCRLIFASSGGTVYGESEYLPIDEEHSRRPISDYGFIKNLSEKTIEYIARTQNLSYSIIRMANCYGPGFKEDKPQGIIGKVIYCLLKKEPIQVIGDGSQVRDYIFVDDIAEACYCIFHENVKRSVVNIGTGIGTDVITVIHMIENIMGTKGEVVYRPTRNIDVCANILDCSRVFRLFGWRYTTNLQTGIYQTYQSVLKKEKE